MKQVPSHSHFTDGNNWLRVLQPWPSTDNTKPRGVLPQSMPPRGHTSPERSATYPFIIPAWAMFSFQLQNGHVLKWWWQEAGKYTDRSMVSKYNPRSGESQPRVVPASPPPALSMGNLSQDRESERKHASLLYIFFFLILSFRSWWESAGWANKLTANTQQEDRTARATRPPACHFLPGAQPSTTPLLNWCTREGLREVHRSVPRVILLTGPARLTKLLEPPGSGYELTG